MCFKQNVINSFATNNELTVNHYSKVVSSDKYTNPNHIDKIGFIQILLF